MNTHTGSRVVRHAWSRVFAVVMICLPRTLRDQHGEAMQELFERDLDQRAGRGAIAVSAAAFAGIADLLVRGLHERVNEARRDFRERDRALLRQLLVGFLAALCTLETLFLLLLEKSRIPADERGLSIAVLSLPYIAAMTIPMAMFVAALCLTSRAHAKARRVSPTADARRAAGRHAIPLVGFATVIAVLSLAVNTQLVPRANARLQVLYARTADTPRDDRSMTVSELRAASKQLEAQTQAPGNNDSLAQIAGYQVEIQKKFALAAASIVLTLLAVAITGRFTTTHPLVLGLASTAVFASYYVALTVGEQLADQLVLSPVLAMWSGNMLVLIATLVITSSARGERRRALAVR